MTGVALTISLLCGIFAVTNEQIKTDFSLQIPIMFGVIVGFGLGLLGMARGFFPELNKPEVSY